MYFSFYAQSNSINSVLNSTLVVAQTQHLCFYFYTFSWSDDSFSSFPSVLFQHLNFCLQHPRVDYSQMYFFLAVCDRSGNGNYRQGAWEHLPWELLYADDLILIAESMESL